MINAHDYHLSSLNFILLVGKFTSVVLVCTAGARLRRVFNFGLGNGVCHLFEPHQLPLVHHQVVVVPLADHQGQGRAVSRQEDARVGQPVARADLARSGVERDVRRAVQRVAVVLQLHQVAVHVVRHARAVPRLERVHCGVSVRAVHELDHAPFRVPGRSVRFEVGRPGRRGRRRPRQRYTVYFISYLALASFNFSRFIFWTMNMKIISDTCLPIVEEH